MQVRTGGIWRLSWCHAQHEAFPQEWSFGRIQMILPQSRHGFSVLSESYFSEMLFSLRQCFIARHNSHWIVIFSLCYWVFSIDYLKSIQGGGALLASGAVISFLTPSYTVFEDKPSFQWGLASVHIADRKTLCNLALGQFSSLAWNSFFLLSLLPLSSTAVPLFWSCRW